MLKLSYGAKALSQIHTGADEKHGTVSMLRREKRRLPNPIAISSYFKSPQDRRENVLNVLLSVYKAIDKELKASNYGFYDAFASKVQAATGVPSKSQFLTELCKSCGVRTIREEDNGLVMESLNKFGDEEFLSTVRDEGQYLMLMLRYAVSKKVDLFTTEKETKEGENLKFEKYFEWVPFIAGNSVRGLIRRLVMKDFFLRIGANKEEFGVYKDIYHQLMTGGNITTSTAFEDIQRREQFVRLCPMIGLLGSAIGNMTITGRMKVGGLRPACKELGDGNISFWETIGREFGTRLDSSKTERDMEIIEIDRKAKSADQMKYEFEVFNAGTEFNGFFALDSDDPVLVSAFYYALKLLKDFGFVGGSSARGMGQIDFGFDIPEGAEKAYLEHLELVKDEAKAVFLVPRKEELSVLA